MSLRAVHKAKAKTKTAVTTQKKPKAKSRRSIWRKLFLIASLALFLALALLVWAWTQRFSLAELELKSRLTERGISAEFSISELSDKRAAANQISLSKNGIVFFEAERAAADFELRDVLIGKFQRLFVSGAQIDLELNDRGQPKLSLLSSGGNGSGTVFPDQGIIVENSNVSIKSPYGNLQTKIAGEIISEREFDLDLEIAESQIEYGDVQATLGGPVKVKRNHDNPLYDIALLVPRWSYKELSGTNLKLTGQGTASRDQTGVNLEGDYKALFDSFAGKAVFSDEGELAWSGNIVIPRQASGTSLASGQWSITVNNFNMPDAERRLSLARRLTLYESFSKAPVMSNFSRPLSGSLSDLLSGGDIKGEGVLNKTDNGLAADLKSPLLWTNKNREILLSKTASSTVYEFDRATQLGTLIFDANISGQLPLSIKTGQLNFNSTNGRNFRGVDEFKAQISTPKSWHSQTPEGQRVRLRPMRASVAYNGGETDSELNLSGQIAYDGDIPGGYVTGLKADGRLYLDIGDNTDIYFQSKSGSKILMEQFQTETPWIANDVSFSLEPSRGAPMYIRKEQSGDLEARVKDLEFDLSNPESGRKMHLVFDQSSLSAGIKTGAQDWNISGTNVVMTSDNLPSVGTKITAPSMNMDVSLRADQPAKFSLTAPQADVQTEAIIARNLSVKASGTPEQFTVNYENGNVAFTATDLPPIKMTGFINYANETWAGSATSFLPFKGDKTPMDIAYKFEDGLGSADVDIPDMVFSPRGLQPQMFVPALRGKIADVEGAAATQMHLEFAPGQPMKSSGTTELIDMSFGTLPGPLTGVNAVLDFSSFFPLVSDGIQSVSIKGFDPGFPLSDGEVQFETVPDGVKIHHARWPMGSGAGSGFVSLDPTDWIYLAAQNRMKLNIENVSLGKFLGDIGGGNFSATGNVNGVLPVIISGINVEVENGQLQVKNGGVIRYRSDQTDAAAAENELAGYAFDALKEFRYQELEATMSGPLDGQIMLRLLFQGMNPEVLGGAVFRFNVALEGELLNIARSFQLGDRIAGEVKRAIEINNAEELTPLVE